MAGLFSKVSKFARSPQGQKLMQQAQAAAKDPKNRAKVEDLGNQLKSRADALRGRKQAPAKPVTPAEGEVVDPPGNQNPR